MAFQGLRVGWKEDMDADKNSREGPCFLLLLPLHTSLSPQRVLAQSQRPLWRGQGPYQAALGGYPVGQTAISLEAEWTVTAMWAFQECDRRMGTSGTT